MVSRKGAHTALGLILLTTFGTANACHSDPSPKAPASGGGGAGDAGASGGASGDARPSCGTLHSSEPLPMDATGAVPPSSNNYCIQGEWTWWADTLSGGKSAFPGLVKGSPPFVAGSGMCIQGSSPGGGADNYTTWGANIMLNLSQSTPSDAPSPLKTAPPCFTITLTGTGAPGGVVAGLCPPPTSSTGTVICPQVALGAGPNEVCIQDVSVPSWCTASAGWQCLDPSELASGIQSVMVQANAGVSGGAIDVCVSSIVPHGYPSADAGGDSSAADGGGLPAIAEGQFLPEAYGTFDLSNLAFAAFSAVTPGEQDPQVLDLAPDLVPRTWWRWDTSGVKSFDYDASYAAACKALGTTFVSGTTASGFYQDEVRAADFLDQVSRDASNHPVPHPELTANAYRGSLVSPAYRQRLVDIGKVQIDSGADGVHFDEVLASYTGTNWTGGNEGFDDHGIADFGAFLCNKYAGSLATLTDSLGVTAEDKLSCAPPSGGRSFDYRGYLARHGAATAPTNNHLNPLAPDWGAVLNNRVTPPAGTFLSTYPAYVYWQQIVVALRTYARDRYQREIAITANGVYPFVDFQNVGLYTPNVDGPGQTTFDWMPVTAGGADGGTTLDGTVSFKSALQALKASSRQTLAATGRNQDVPIVLFLDYPTPSLDRFYALPPQGRKDYFRLYGAETYALGMFFAVPLHLNTDQNTATSLGLMDLFKQLKAFYKGHADVYRGAEELSDTPTVSAPNTTAVLNKLPDGRRVLHVINHAYAGGVVSQHGITATFPMPAAPASVSLVSPDFAADKTPPFTYTNGSVTVAVGDLDAYIAVVAK